MAEVALCGSDDVRTAMVSEKDRHFSPGETVTCATDV